MSKTLYSPLGEVASQALRATHIRRRDQALDMLLRALVLHEEVLRPVELAHINAAIALLREDRDE